MPSARNMLAHKIQFFPYELGKAAEWEFLNCVIIKGKIQKLWEHTVGMDLLQP